MKKDVLLASVLLASAGAFAQNGKIVPKNAVPVNAAEIEMKRLTMSEEKVVSTPHATHAIPAPKNHKKGGNQQVAVVSAQRFSGSMNAYGLLVSQQRVLNYNSDVDIVTFAHRKSPYFSTNPVSNSGSIVFSWSLNKGTTWDSSCVWADGTNLARYPQGGIYNPPGNTNVNNIHFVATGPVTQGSGWEGGYFASKSYTDAVGGNPTALPSPYMQFFPTASFGTKVYMPRYFFTYTKDGLVRSAGSLIDDPNATTNLAFNPRGTALFIGQYNAGSFNWSVDTTFKPPVEYSTVNGNALLSIPIMAWNDNGDIGYVVMIGTRLGSTGTQRGMQPLVYKTTNYGATWTLIPGFDFTTLSEVNKRLPIATGNYTYAIPFFSTREGISATVDGMGRLHLVGTVVSAYSDHVDSLFYPYAFNSGGGCGSQNYIFYYGSTTTHPTIMDFILENNNTWNGILVDSMATEGTVGGSNTCSQWDAAGLSIDARIQVSRDDAGSKIFYSWTETDTTVTGHHFNVYPDLYAKGYDINAQAVTNRMLVIGTGAPSPTDAQFGIFWHFMSPKVINVGGGTYEIPFTFSADNTFSGTSPVDHYYVSGFQFTNADFTYTATPLSANNSSSSISKNNTIDVNVYPNPTSDNTNIVVNLNNASNMHVEITNALGQVINSMDINAQAGQHIINVDLSNEKAGVYFYNVTTNNGKSVGKLIKQ